MSQSAINEKPVFVSRRMEQQWMRMQAVKMARSGMGVPEIAKFFNVSIRSIFKWIAAYSSGGQKALQAKDGAGRPPKVKPEELAWIAATVKDHTPDQLKFEFGLWTVKLISALIERELNLKLSAPTVMKIMKQLGFTAQKPLYRAYEQSATLVQEWRDTRYPEIKKRAKEQGARIMYADEAGLRSDYHTGTTWAPKGQTPVVRTTGKRFSIQMLSAVGQDGHFEFMLREGRVNSEVFCDFLRQLILGSKQPVFLIVDGSSIHKAKVVKEFLEENKGKIELHIIPPYSPELNPDEQVWKNVKAEVSKQKLLDREDLFKLTHKALSRLKDAPKIIMGFFRHPEVAC
jgi:transposase